MRFRNFFGLRSFSYLALIVSGSLFHSFFLYHGDRICTAHAPELTYVCVLRMNLS